jgi:hypothetical protein
VQALAAMLGCGCMPDLIEARPRTTVTQEHAMATGRTWSNSSLAHRLTSGGTRRSARLGTQLLPAYASSARRSTSKRTRLFPMPAAHLRQGPTAQPLAAPPNQTTCGAPTPPHPPSTHARTHACRTAHWSPHTVSRNAHPHRTNSRQGGGRSCAASLSFFDEGRGGAGGGEEGFPLAQQPLLQSAPAPPSEFTALSLGEVFAAAKASTDPVRTRYYPLCVHRTAGLAPAAAAGPAAPPPPRRCAALLGPKDRRLHRRKPKRAGCGVHGERGAGVPSST